MGCVRRPLRIASLDGLGAGSIAVRSSSSGGAENDRNKKVNEIVRAVVGSKMKEGDIVVAFDSKSKLWKDMCLKRAIQNWNMKYVDVARSPGSALRVFTSSEQLANQVKTNEVGRSWKIGFEDRDECSETLKIGEEEQDGCSKSLDKLEKLSRKADEEGRDGWYESSRLGEEVPNERNQS